MVVMQDLFARKPGFTHRFTSLGQSFAVSQVISLKGLQDKLRSILLQLA
jgi:hypothetical protein